jgi:hypothetical protein
MKPERLAALQVKADALHTHQYKEDRDRAALDLADEVPALIHEIEGLQEEIKRLQHQREVTP